MRFSYRLVRWADHVVISPAVTAPTTDTAADAMPTTTSAFMLTFLYGYNLPCDPQLRTMENLVLFCRYRALLGLSWCASIGGRVPAARSAFGQRRATRSLQGTGAAVADRPTA